MRWDASTVAHFAQEAGVPYQLVPGFVAIAIATSGGHDDYEARAGSPGAGRWLGLWGINVDAHPECERLSLCDPQVNAYAAVHLALKHRTLRVFPAFASRQYVHHLPVARAGMSLGPWGERERVPVSVVLHETLGSGDPHRLRRLRSG